MDGRTTAISQRSFFSLGSMTMNTTDSSLDLRVVLGGGLGYSLWTGENGRFALVAGAEWNRESFSPAPPAAPFTRNSAEAYWGNDFNFKMNTRTTLVQSFRMFNNLSNAGEYRMNSTRAQRRCSSNGSLGTLRSVTGI